MARLLMVYEDEQAEGSEYKGRCNAGRFNSPTRRFTSSWNTWRAASCMTGCSSNGFTKRTGMGCSHWMPVFPSNGDVFFGRKLRKAYLQLLVVASIFSENGDDLWK